VKKDAFLIALAAVASTGELVWQRSYDSSLHDFDGPVIEMRAGSIVFGGTAGSWDEWAEPFLVEIDDEGDILWQRSYRLPGLSFISNLIESFDGGLIAVGNTGGAEACDLIGDASFPVRDGVGRVVTTNGVERPTEFTVSDADIPRAVANAAPRLECAGE
jgi:outer membrane protein assembly factor BamB